MKKNKEFDVVELDQLDMLTQPLRLEIVDNVAHHGPLSVNDIALMLGRNPSTLHFHIKKLLGTGLLLPAGERGTGRRREALYRTPGAPVSVVYDRTNPSVVEATVQYATNTLARAKRALTAAFGSRKVVTSGPQRDAHIDQMTCWLDDRELGRLNRNINAIRESIPVGPHRPGTRLHLVTVSISPLPVAHPQLRSDKQGGSA